MNWLIYAMIYLGSALMVYNIYSYVRYAGHLQEKDDWGKERNILYIPIFLLVLFLLGYLAVGFFGKPDLIISGILFGGSIFVFIVFKLLEFITARVQKNEHLEAKLIAAEESSKLKSQFLSIVSHEMRTPMNGIIGLNYLALKNPDLPAMTRRQLDKIGENADHLKALIDNILDMTDFDEGKVDLKQDTFSLISLLNDINLLIRGQCIGKGLNYSYAVVGKLDDYYVGDKGKVRQILLSLLGNAVKYTPAPGNVSFTAEQIPSDMNTRRLRFTVSDTGIGIDEDYMEKIFTAFSREHNALTDTYGGIGLSLALTKKIASLMDGTIEVSSEKNVGSTFTVTISLGKSERKAEPQEKLRQIDPAAEQKTEQKLSESEQEGPGSTVPDNTEPESVQHVPDETAAEPETENPETENRDSVTDPSEPVPAENTQKGIRVLIAEDIDLNAEILADLLEMEDISSERAENGEIAVRMFRENPENYYDAVLMDLRMPVMDGFDAARNIRALDRSDAASIPIIALTANASHEDRQNVIEAGMDSHLTKPVDSELLFETLNRLIRRSRETV